MELVIRTAELEDINTIGYLAYQIWPTAYKDILSLEQLHYMLGLLYSPTSLKKQMTIDHHNFLLAELEEEPVGFASFSKMEETNHYKLHKIYVLPELQGKAVGKALLMEVENLVVELGGIMLQLNVNRHNKAISFYQKRGFSILREENIDIGNNFQMNDYVMEKKLPE